MRLMPAAGPSRAIALATGLAAAVIIVGWGVLRPAQAAYDDAYITYRYADNLRHGLGLVYNPGEWVLGTTTPLFAVLLGALGLIVPDLESAGHWLGVLSWVAAAWAGMAVVWQMGRPRAALVSGMLIACEPALLPSLGMETGLLLALMFTFAWAWLAGRSRLAIGLGAALLLTRQDSALWMLALGVEVWRRDRGLPWRVAAGVTLLTAPWFGYAWLRYGAILPNSALAKLGQNALMPVGGQAPFARALWEAGSAGLHPVVALMAAAALALGIGVIVRSVRSAWWLPGWTVLYAVGYVWLGVASFPWYFVPPLAAVSLLMGLGLGQLLGDGARAAPARGARALAALGAVAGLALGLNRAAVMRGALGAVGHRAAYLQAGRWLAANAPEQARVATIEIGVIGYLSQRPVLDTMGLVSPDMTRHQVGWQETLAYAIDAHQPDYALTLPGTAWDGIVNRWWFRQQYTLAAQIEEVSLYRRVPMAATLNVPASVAYADGISLEGIDIPAAGLAPGTALDALLNIRVRDAPAGRYAFALALVDAQTFAQVAATTAEPLDGAYGTQRWQPGDRLALPLRLDVPADLKPGAYRLAVVVTNADAGSRLRLREQPEVADPDVRLGWFRVGSPPQASATGFAALPQAWQWRDGIRLSGLAVPVQPVAPGDVLRVRLTWTAGQPIARDLTVFVHVVDGQGRIAAQTDRPPFGGRWPTPVWRAGETLSDIVEIALPADLPGGAYGLRIGLYDAAGPLPLADASADFGVAPGAVRVAGR